MEIFGGITAVTLKKSLNATSMRHEAIAHNIANVNTPKFKRVDVDFKTQLRKALDRNSDPTVRGVLTNPGHIQIDPPSLNEVKPLAYRDTETGMRVDGNNVDIDVEMGTLSQNTMFYDVLVRLTSDYYNQIETAIRGRL